MDRALDEIVAERHVSDIHSVSRVSHFNDYARVLLTYGSISEAVDLEEDVVVEVGEMNEVTIRETVLERFDNPSLQRLNPC